MDQNRSQALLGKLKFSRRSSRDSNPRPFNHESGALTTELSPPPNSCLACLALFIAGWPRKLKGCLGEGVKTTTINPPGMKNINPPGMKILIPGDENINPRG